MAILIVEDNEDSLTMLDYLLRAHGYATLLARNGADGVRIATQKRPELILLDIRMPGMDGYEVAAAIRSTSGLGQTRIVAVTASVMDRDLDAITAAGFDGYVSKPIDPETFMAEIEQFLPTPAAQPRTRREANDELDPRPR
jgi:two-component system, cell cycle response regulator DivK